MNGRASERFRPLVTNLGSLASHATHARQLLGSRAKACLFSRRSGYKSHMDLITTLKQWAVGNVISNVLYDLLKVGLLVWLWSRLVVLYRTLQYHRRWRRLARQLAQYEGRDMDLLDVLVRLNDPAPHSPEAWALQESMGSYTLSEEDLYEYLRIRCFGRRTWADRLLRIKRVSLKDALRPRSEKSPSPLEKSLNEIVWRIERKWLFASPDHRIGPHTGELRISGYAIQRVICKLYGLKDLSEIEVAVVPTPGGVRPYDIRAFQSARCPLELPTLTLR
jgi:hypothetical protein